VLGLTPGVSFGLRGPSISKDRYRRQERVHITRYDRWLDRLVLLFAYDVQEKNIYKKNINVSKNENDIMYGNSAAALEHFSFLLFKVDY
jgi:hypothetical protein